MMICSRDVSVRKAQGGFTLIEALVSLGIMGVLLVALTQFSDFASNFQRMNTAVGTQEKMRVVRSAIMQMAQDVDGDGYFELLAPDAGTKIPASLNLGTYSTDEWGTTFLYCAYDIGNSNFMNNSFVSNSPAYASDHALGMIVSAGKNTSFQTTCADVVAQGDDLGLQVAEADVRYSKGGFGGFGHQTGKITPLTESDNINLEKSLVTVGTFTLLPSVDPMGNAILAGTIAYQSVAGGGRNAGLHLFDGTTWKPIEKSLKPANCYNTFGSCSAGYYLIAQYMTIDSAPDVYSPPSVYWKNVCCDNNEPLYYEMQVNHIYDDGMCPDWYPYGWQVYPTCKSGYSVYKTQGAGAARLYRDSRCPVYYGLITTCWSN